MKDAVAFMAWQRLVPWKILSMIAQPKENLIPNGFGSRSRNFYELLEPGSQIWVVTRIAKEYSLAGRLKISEILDGNCISQDKWPVDVKGLLKKWRYVARADFNDSEFYETNNAGPVILKHQIEFTQYRPIVYRDASLHDSFAACINQSRKTVFISYRWDEGRRFAFSLAKEFRKKGRSPWLDAHSMPAYEASREKKVDAPMLKKLIRLGINKSTLAVVINTETYPRKLWTSMELEHIRKAGIPWFQVMRGGRKQKFYDHPVFSKKPEEIVKEILKQCVRC